MNPPISHAQESRDDYRLALFAGASLPVGGFGEVTGEDAGYARPGPCLTLDVVGRLSCYVNWVSSVTQTLNRLGLTDSRSIRRPAKQVQLAVGFDL